MTSPSDPFIEHSLRTSMFCPESRLFVAGNPKAAGTSLRWWLLEAHGVDVTERTARSLWGESAPFQTVWDGRIDLDFTWKDLRTGKILVERRRFEQSTTYYPTLGEGQFVGSQQNVERLALAIVQEMQADW